MPKIFLSYRRADSISATGRLHEYFVDAFGDENIFKDVEKIPPGVDFRDFLNDAVTNCDILLAIIGQQWVGIQDAQGNRRLDDENDFVRLEVASALADDSITVIPILVEGAAPPSADQLPEPLKNLAYRNAFSVRNDPDFRRDAQTLIEEIKTLYVAGANPNDTGAYTSRLTTAETQAVTQGGNNTGMIIGGVIAVIAIIAVVLFVVMGGNGDNPATLTETAVADAALLDDATETAQAAVTEESTATPTDEPTATPTDEPMATPTDEPTATPTDEPSATPTDEPTTAPTATDTPTDVPVAISQSIISTLNEVALSPEQLNLVEQEDEIVIDNTGEDDVYSYAGFDAESTQFVISTTAEWGPGATNDTCGMYFYESEDASDSIQLVMDREGFILYQPWIDNQWGTVEEDFVDGLNIEEGDSNNFVLIVYDSHIRFFINEQLVMERTTPSKIAPSSYMGLAAGTAYDSDVSHCTFYDTQVYTIEGDAPVTLASENTQSTTPSEVSSETTLDLTYTEGLSNLVTETEFEFAEETVVMDAPAGMTYEYDTDEDFEYIYTPEGSGYTITIMYINTGNEVISIDDILSELEDTLPTPEIGLVNGMSTALDLSTGIALVQLPSDNYLIISTGNASDDVTSITNSLLMVALDTLYTTP